MQSHSLTLLTITASMLFALTGCQNDTDPGANITPATVSANDNSVTSSTFRYANSVFYNREQPEAYIETPIKNQSGTYSATPKGLVIDPSTGAIDVNKSEAGLTYRVSFKPTGSSETVSNEVTIAGINFQSRIYNLASGDAMATPFYNVQSNRPSPFETVNRAAGNEFANNNDRAIAARLSAYSQQNQPEGVEIDPQSGAIDLRKAVANGIFGDKPADGTVRTYRLYYRLNDASRKALSYIDVRLHYYSHTSAVPSALLAQAKYKTEATFRQTTSTTSLSSSRAFPAVADVSLETERPTRPPDIIIVGD